jgi:3-hydroxymyristoyl/3-hydroxydecanoyl-(acyl carrier protein) dehydratase
LLEIFGERPPPELLDPEQETVGIDEGGREQVSLTFTVPADLSWFDGHFPGRPILAGVVQLQGLVLRQVSRRWPQLGVPRKVLRLKFKRVIGPGDRLTLRLVHHETASRIDFDLSTGQLSCASGTFHFASASPGTGS